MAVLSVTGTERSWAWKWTGGDRVSALCVIIAARFPPAEEPPVASLDTSTESSEGPSAISQRRASQQSWTAAGQRSSGASLGENKTN